jgi:hypothetical protein
MVRKQKGGAKLIHPEKTGFQATFDMLNSAGSILKLLTIDSLHGFMFELIVDPDDTEYYTFSADGTLTLPITNFILKIVVTSPISQRLGSYEGVNKMSMTPNSFLNEAKMQQTIWLTSISGGRPEICPAVANLSFFDNVQSHGLIHFLSGSANIKSDAIDILKYLEDTLTRLSLISQTCGLGIILMPKIMNSLTAHEFVKRDRNVRLPGASDDEIDAYYKLKLKQDMEAHSNILAQVVRLFIDIGIIHTDLHSSNVLVYPSTTGFKSEIIDFGHAINVNIRDDDINDKKNEFQTQFFKIISPPRRQSVFSFGLMPSKDVFMDSVISYINTVNATYGNPSQTWLVDFEDEDRDAYSLLDVYSRSFDILKEYYVTDFNKRERMTQKTIKSYISKGEFVNLDKDVGTFYASLPLPTHSAAMSISEMQMASVPPQQLRLERDPGTSLILGTDELKSYANGLGGKENDGMEIDNHEIGGNKSKRNRPKNKRPRRINKMTHRKRSETIGNQRKRTRKRGKQRPRSKRI